MRFPGCTLPRAELWTCASLSLRPASSVSKPLPRLLKFEAGGRELIKSGSLQAMPTVFRPCIDLHNGAVKQIVGGTLDTSLLRTNFVSECGRDPLSLSLSTSRAN